MTESEMVTAVKAQSEILNHMVIEASKMGLNVRFEVISHRDRVTNEPNGYLSCKITKRP